ncbi:Gfo/Idh/MocA family protein [Microlunatus speluncae]|uniref:Gfo/Idh/MocA family protein n=1 Tax=Microlunatus speluncae TaxID=2594267 RepID=UPI001376015D|nr:Gfo/Idh/MocA family oxidoreductase [Microlunatus speluncae]
MIMSDSALRLAVVGGRRGRHFGRALSRLEDRIRLAAVCDLSGAVLDSWQGEFPAARTYRRFEELLADDGVDAVFLATPLPLHARQAIAALEAGKHVLSEVTAANTLADGQALIEAVERTGRTYMLAENYCFMRPNLMVEKLAARGEFGAVTYLEGGYLHDCRHLMHEADGSLTWRGQLRVDANSVYYPTHSLGPVARWLRAANGDDDRLTSVAAFTTRTAAVSDHFAERFGGDHPGAAPDHWLQGDSGTAMITTTSGALISLRVDASSPRPHNMTHYAVQGTRGAYQSARRDGEDPLIWLARDAAPAANGAEPERDWSSLWDYAGEFESDQWRDRVEIAAESGHGGGDFFVLEEFATAIAEGRAPTIDVHDAVLWSAVVPLSVESIRRGGAPVEFPEWLRPTSAPEPSLTKQ